MCAQWCIGLFSGGGRRLGLLESFLDFFENLFYLVNGHDALPEPIGTLRLPFGIDDHGVCGSAFCHVRKISRHPLRDGVCVYAGRDCICAVPVYRIGSGSCRRSSGIRRLYLFGVVLCIPG